MKECLLCCNCSFWIQAGYSLIMGTILNDVSQEIVYLYRKLKEILVVNAISCWSSYIQILSVRSNLSGIFG